jgi:hypothetical protein
LHQVNSNLPADAVTADIVMHAKTLIAVIDAQKTGDQTAVFAALNPAVAHMADTAKTLAVATAAKFPDKFDGDAASPAADLRAALTSVLAQHVWLAADATDAALGGRQAEFDAAAAALNGPTDSNTSTLVDAVGSIYGDEVKTAFDGLWRSEDHIPQFVAYTQAAAANDEAGKQAAVAKLTAYAKTFGETLHSVNENLPADAVEQDITMHATTLIAVIDAQKAGDAAGTYKALEQAYTHMNGTAKVLAEATAKKFPEKFDGDAASPASELRSGLTSLLSAHVWIASDATDAALAGRQADFEAAATALNGPTDSNTSELVAAIGSVYGPDVQTAFDGLWRSEDHIPQFVAYTQAVAKGDTAAADAAIAKLQAYAKTFGETLNQVNANLPVDAVTQDIVMHATSLKAVIDAQKAKDPQEGALLRAAVAHMYGTASVLADATVKKFPGKF